MHNVTPISYLVFYVIGIDIETEIHFSMSVHTSHWKMNSISCTNKMQNHQQQHRTAILGPKFISIKTRKKSYGEFHFRLEESVSEKTAILSLVEQQ